MGLIDIIVGKFGIKTNFVLRQKLEKEQSFREILEKKVKEADELAELYLEDKKETEERYQNLKLVFDNQGRYVKIFLSLSEIERKLLCEFIPHRRSTTFIDDKIHYTPHSDPNGFKDFLKKVASWDYVGRIDVGRQVGSIKKISFHGIFNEDKIWKIKGCYSRDNFGKSILIHTTAQKEMEAMYVRDLLRHTFKLV